MPGVVAVVVFHFVPVGFGAYYAFTDWSGVGDAKWIGLGNFRDIFSDRTARGALWHTLELAGLFVLCTNAIGLVLALGLNRAVKARNLLRSLFFAPTALSPLAIAFIWQWVFDYQGGLNRLLSGVGLGSLRHTWLGDPSTALWTVLVVMIWQFSGLAMVLYLAGLQGISDDVYEATLVDGASTWLRVRSIVLPLLAPALTVSLTLTLIIGLRVFDQIIALTNGGPVDASETLATQIYKQTFVAGRFGYGAALGLVLAAIIGVLALTQLAFMRRNEERL
ncbi:MAG: raffinose/stachyose/melibiose transport system permease protein [Gaiellaceae bacterium]|nr:raffinose/stachyose/melibiose transport system permease protein [Gaiellaceae bacterium]